MKPQQCDCCRPSILRSDHYNSDINHYEQLYKKVIEMALYMMQSPGDYHYEDYNKLFDKLTILRFNRMSDILFRKYIKFTKTYLDAIFDIRYYKCQNDVMRAKLARFNVINDIKNFGRVKLEAPSLSITETTTVIPIISGYHEYCRNRYGDI